MLRLLDASANRAREALRVLEDYARFVLDDGPLSARLKSIRHDLAWATDPWLSEAVLHRDTPGDVGVANKTADELTRADLSDVLTAAGKRLGEALRSIEEYLKTFDPLSAGVVESIRYEAYEAERLIALTLIGAARRFGDVRLYVLVTESICSGPWLATAEAAIVGGADCIQLREKDLESGELLRRARQLVALCRDHGVLCVINDRPDIALLADADGVHVGQGDLPALEARKIVGARRIVGVSTHQLEQARQAVLDGADYIGVGPFFPSATKPRDFTAGPEYARLVAESIRLPAVAIAGITTDNVDQVTTTGIKAIAVSSAVVAASDPAAATRALKDRLPALIRRAGGQTFLSVARGRRPLSKPSPYRPPSQSQPIEKVTRRHLPHLQIEGSTYFITFRLRSGEMDAGERFTVLSHIKSGHGKFYRLIASVVMPDHVHALLAPLNGFTLDRVLKGTKGVTANLINRRRRRSGPLWQEESWDRIMQTQNQTRERLLYMLNNPVRKALVKDGWDYDGWYCDPAVMVRDSRADR